MFYKLMNNDILVDLLREVRYVRYLPKSKRWINTDAMSANGIMNMDGSKIYHISGRAIAYPSEITSVRIVKIDEKEYNMLATQYAVQRKENEELREEIDSLRAQLNEQSSLLQQILAKLS